MIWKKQGKNYTVECDGKFIYYNLDGLKIKESGDSQGQANAFLKINGFYPFQEDKPKKSFTKITGELKE